jgi:YggT family protein
VTVICALLTAYLVVLGVRAVMSWFPVRPGTPLSTLYGILLDLTEPVLAPLRRIIPPAGMFDLSFMVLFFVLIILRSVACAAG